MAEVKKPLTYSVQLSLLKSRGCFIENDEVAIKILENINYYRLSAYFLPFKTDAGEYKSGTSLDKVYSLYEFDRELRQIIFSTIEETEIFLRAKISYFHATKYGSLGYLEPSNFNKNHRHAKFTQNFEREVAHNKKNAFVKHHLEKYNGKFPLWVATELFTFGMLSKMYADLILQDQKELARNLYCSVPKAVASCLRCCTDLRNICAHYGRLYNRVFSAMPDIKYLSDKEKRSLWGALLALREL